MAALLVGMGAQAEPLVTGFERFHGEVATREGGALLYSELGCVNCHGEGPGLAARQGPVLSDLKTRVNAEWVRAFLADPQQVKPGTMMPAMFAGLDDNQKAVQVEAVTLGLPHHYRHEPWVDQCRWDNPTW